MLIGVSRLVGGGGKAYLDLLSSRGLLFERWMLKGNSSCCHSREVKPELEVRLSSDEIHQKGGPVKEWTEYHK